jgi:GR25 family glycosyltransferase involved in LPS biosynthesis
MRRQIPELEVFTDAVGDGYALFLEICRAINDTGGVVLEDDIQLCRDFKARLEDIVNEKGDNQVINFFERPKVRLETACVGGSEFFWMQCVYLPPLLPGKIAGYYGQFKAERPKQWKGMATDRLIGYTLVKERMKYWRIRPTLVQHLPFPSVIGNRPTNRQTLYFIDDVERQ